MQYDPPMLTTQPANGLTCGIDWARDDHVIAIVDCKWSSSASKHR